MEISNFRRDLLVVSWAHLFVFSAAHAEVHKWVDSNGQTHYSERKEDAAKDKGQAVELKIKPQPASTEATRTSSE